MTGMVAAGAAGDMDIDIFLNAQFNINELVL